MTREQLELLDVATDEIGAALQAAQANAERHVETLAQIIAAVNEVRRDVAKALAALPKPTPTNGN